VILWTKKNCADERKSTDTDDQFIYKARKKALGAFKKDIMNLPEEVKEAIAGEIEAKFEFLFKQLKAINNKDIVNTFVKPKDYQLDFGKAGKATLDGEGDD